MLVSCKQWFVRVLFSCVTKQSRKSIFPFSLVSLVNWNASILRIIVSLPM